MKFKSKVIEIQAWRWDCGEPMPEWLVRAEKDYRVRFRNNRKLGSTYANGNMIFFREDDWLIYNGPDDIYPCNDETFKRKYEAIDA